MELNNFLSIHFDKISNKHISINNDFHDYENFKNFIVNHYGIRHLENNNYIKFVKVKRQIIKLEDEITYNNHLYNINKTIQLLSKNHVFPNLNIRRYMYRIDGFFKLIEFKRKVLYETVNTIRNLFDLKGDDNNFKFKIIISINAISQKYRTFKKYSKQLINYVNELVNFEESYGIDHKLIELNNLERKVLGKKSEYTANKIINDYVNKINKISDKKYFYEINIDFLKLLNIKAIHESSIKGEVDGMIICYDGTDYIIEKIIEVKSSIKATFEDIQKFLFLRTIIDKSINDDIKINYGKYVFTRKSFMNIINKDLADWTTYICINKINHDIIEKSHLYFSTVLKIIDDNFIKDFYVDQNENSIKKKYEIVIKNTELIDNLFEIWKKNIKFNNENCNIFISRN